VLDLPSPIRMMMDRTYHAGKLTGRDLPPALPDPPDAGTVGERSIAHAYRKAFARARRLIYIEDQYLWAPFVADLLASALEANPELHVIAIVPRFPDKEGASRWPSLVGREQAIKVCRSAGGERFGIYDVENHAGNPVYVHAKVVDPAGLGEGARVFARELRLELWREHLDRSPEDAIEDLLDPERAFKAMHDSAARQRAGVACLARRGTDGPTPAWSAVPACAGTDGLVAQIPCGTGVSLAV
jgi:hypothetical protein